MSRNGGVVESPFLQFGWSTEASVHIPSWRQDGWLVQSWLPPCSSCRERGIPKMHCCEQAFLVSVASLAPWLAVNIRWGLDNITTAIWIIKSSYSIISLFLWGGKRVWNTGPSRLFLRLTSLSQTWLQRLNVLDYKMYIIWGSSYKSTRQVC